MKEKRYWLIKSEGNCYSIDDLKRDVSTPWTGIRNYQARNFMRDDMHIGDLVLFYHSMSEPTGIYGIAKVSSTPHPDLTAFDKKDEHYDPKSKKKQPTWMLVDMSFVKKFKEPISLEAIKKESALEDMVVRQKGSRLSVQPVSKEHYLHIVENMAK
jgi:predicted RNA-binding protein with PUA-like domain